MITTETVSRIVADIAASAGDDEGAHGMEDALYSSILLAIAQGEIDGEVARDCAALALETRAIRFARWCA